MTNLEPEVRARRLTAVLEEAVGDGVPHDLTERVADRLAGLPRRHPRRAWLTIACIAAGILVVFAVARLQGSGSATSDSGRFAVEGPAEALSQDPIRAAPVLTVAIRCLVEGKAVLRTSAAGEAGGRRWEGRQLQWRIGDRAFDTLEALASELKVRATPERRGTDPAQAVREAPALLLEPGPGVRWAELIAATDAAMMARFTVIRWAGIDTPWLVPKVVGEPVIGGGVLVVPRARFAEPDDDAHERRPTFDLHQDGRIVHGNATLFTPEAGVPHGLDSVRAGLRELRAALVAKGDLGKRTLDQKERLQVPILVRADCWTECSQVQQFLALALGEEIGFWKVEIAVADRDLDGPVEGAKRK